MPFWLTCFPEKPHCVGEMGWDMPVRSMGQVLGITFYFGLPLLVGGHAKEGAVNTLRQEPPWEISK